MASKKDQDNNSTNDIEIHGNIGPGSAVGPSAHIEAQNIAGGDISISTQPVQMTVDDFIKQINALEALLHQAKKTGELTLKDSGDATSQLAEVTQMVTREQQPSKSRIIRRFEDIQEILEGAGKAAESTGKVGKSLLKAIPVVAGLIKLAQTLF
jgi:hypothetical protein